MKLLIMARAVINMNWIMGHFHEFVSFLVTANTNQESLLTYNIDPQVL